MLLQRNMIAFTRQEKHTKNQVANHQQFTKRGIFAFFEPVEKIIQITQGNRGCKNQSVRKQSKKQAISQKPTSSLQIR